MADTALPGELALARLGNRITIAGDVRTVADRELLRTLVNDAIAELRTEQPELVLDVAAAKYLDSWTLAQLVILARKCVDCGMVLAIEGASDEFVELLRITQIDRVLKLHGARVSARPAA